MTAAEELRERGKKHLTQNNTLLKHSNQLQKKKSISSFKSKTIPYADYLKVKNTTNIKIQAYERPFWEKYSSDVESEISGWQKRLRI